MSRKKKKRPAQPDEEFTAGPIRVARFGNIISSQVQWPEGAFDEWQLQLAERHPQIVAEINRLVAEIAADVSRLSALPLLLYARELLVMRHVKPKTEAEIDSGDILALRMVDYIQSVIAAVPPSDLQRKEVTDKDWAKLERNVQELFEKINRDYLISLEAKREVENQSNNSEFERFRFEAQLLWCNIRGHRYQAHVPGYLGDMFLPHTEVLRELFGLSGEQFVKAFIKIRDALTFGIGSAIEDFTENFEDMQNAFERKLATHPVSNEAEASQLWADVVKENGWEQRQQDVSGRLFGADLYDVKKITGLPQELLDELAWSPGQDQEFFAKGEHCGWPLGIWPIFKRPFIRLGGRYYCFELYSLFDNLYRVMQRVIMHRKPDYREAWNCIQKNLSERLPLKYLQRILPGSTVRRSISYRWKAGSDNVQWCETDGLLIFDDHLFIIECKGGAFTYTPPASDFPAHVKSIENLVLKPANQGTRFLDYLKSSDSVNIFDNGHQPIGKIRRADFRCVTICTVTLDPFTEIAARVQHLRKIGVDVGDLPIWSISLDNLRTFADIFTNPVVFLHFVEQRLRAFQSTAIECNDELDHLGLYFKHNHYTQYVEVQKQSDDTKFGFSGYRSDIDRFFAERLNNPDAPCWLTQDIPQRIVEIIDFLSSSNKPGRSKAASFLLDCNGEWREFLSNNIEEELRQQTDTKRAKPLSTHGKVNVTLFCWKPPLTYRNADFALEHARTVLLLNEDKTRLLLELTYCEDDTLEDISWQWVNSALIREPLRARLRASGESRKTATTPHSGAKDRT